MPFIRYLPKNMGDVQLYLHRIDDNVVVEFGKGAELPGVRTVADLRALPTWLKRMRLLVDREPPGLVRVEPIYR
jgi:hypothetical protein